MTCTVLCTVINLTTTSPIKSTINGTVQAERRKGPFQKLKTLEVSKGHKLKRNSCSSCDKFTNSAVGKLPLNGIEAMERVHVSRFVKQKINSDLHFPPFFFFSPLTSCKATLTGNQILIVDCISFKIGHFKMRFPEGNL